MRGGGIKRQDDGMTSRLLDHVAGGDGRIEHPAWHPRGSATARDMEQTVGGGTPGSRWIRAADQGSPSPRTIQAQGSQAMQATEGARGKGIGGKGGGGGERRSVDTGWDSHEVVHGGASNSLAMANVVCEVQDKDGERADGKKCASWGLWRVICLFIWSSSGNVALLVGMTVGRVSRELLLATFMSKAMGEFYKTLTNKDSEGFIANCKGYLLIIVVSTILDSMCSYASEMLYVRWRFILTTKLNSVYMANRHFYLLDHTRDGTQHDPGQRVASDARLLCEVLGKLCDKMVASPATIIIYSYTTYLSIGLVGPLGVWLFFIIGITINVTLASSTVGKRRVVLQHAEGRFRSAIMGLHARAEQAAMMRSEEFEGERLGRAVLELRDRQGSLAFAHMLVKLVSDMCTYLGGVGNYGLMAVAVFLPGWWAHSMDDSGDPSDMAAAISTASYNCLMLIQGFSLFAEHSADYGDLKGYAARVAAFLNNVQGLASASDRVVDEESKSAPTINRLMVGRKDDDQQGSQVMVENLDIASPQRTVLVANLSFTLSPGMPLLIVGPSGSGKTAIVRTLAGLWKPIEGVGSLTMPPHDAIAFLPQIPVCVPGTIFEQVSYPEFADSFSSPALHKALDDVGLGYLSERYADDESMDDWSATHHAPSPLLAHSSPPSSPPLSPLSPLSHLHSLLPLLPPLSPPSPLPSPLRFQTIFSRAQPRSAIWNPHS